MSAGDCPTCHGGGYLNVVPKEGGHRWVPCPKCDGTGKKNWLRWYHRPHAIPALVVATAIVLVIFVGAILWGKFVVPWVLR